MDFISMITIRQPAIISEARTERRRLDHMDNMNTL
jgi:hypothetical protein